MNEKQTEQHLIVPRAMLEELLENQRAMLKLLKRQMQGEPVMGYVTQSEAMQLLKRKPTWFYQMRTSGKLGFSKVGRTVYYALSEIEKLLTENHKQTVGTKNKKGKGR